MSKIVNDIHSALNRTEVDGVLYPDTQAEVVKIVAMARQTKKKITVCGGRGAMGGQQFGQDCILVDLAKLNRVLQLKHDSVVVEAGIDWPTLHESLLSLQRDQKSQISFRQKQTGADFLTLGGSLSANAHGRGLHFPPMISDVISFRILNAGDRFKSN